MIFYNIINLSNWEITNDTFSCTKTTFNFIWQVTILQNEFDKSFFEFDRSNSSIHLEDESHKDHPVGPDADPKEAKVNSLEPGSDPLKVNSPKSLRAASEADSVESLLDKSVNPEINPIDDKLLGPDQSFDFDKSSFEGNILETENQRDRGLDATEEGKSQKTISLILIFRHVTQQFRKF